MELDGVNFKITADHSQLKQADEAVDEFARSADKAQDEVDKFGNALTQADRKAGRFIDSTGRMREANGKFVRGMTDGTRAVEQSSRSAANAVSMLQAAIAALGVSAFIQQVSAVQDLDTRLRALSGTTEDYAQNSAFLEQTADRLGMNIRDLTDSYAGLLSIQQSGLITQDRAQSLTLGLANASKVLALSSGQTSGVVYGLSQALASGVVRAEEFNQVVEPIPGILAKMEKAAGLGAGQLRQLMLDGQLTSEMFSDLLTVALQDYESQAIQSANNISANTNRLSNELTALYQSLAPGVSIMVDAIADGVSGIVDTVIPFLQTAMIRNFEFLDGVFTRIGYAWEVMTLTVRSAWSLVMDQIMEKAAWVVHGLANLLGSVGADKMSASLAGWADGLEQSSDATEQYKARIQELNAVLAQELQIQGSVADEMVAEIKARRDANVELSAAEEIVIKLNDALGNNAGASGKAAKATKQHRDSYAELLGLFDEGQAAYNRYYDTVQRIAESTATAAEKTQLMALAFKALQDQQKEAYSLDSAPDVGESMGGVLGQFAQLDEAEARVNEWYEDQIAKLDEFRELKAERTAEWDAMEAEAYMAQQERLNQIDQARKDLQLATLETTFGSVADTMRTAFGEQSGIYKIAFAAEKAFAIARSIVAIQAGIAQAASLPFPANLAAMATVAANTASIVANIQSVAMVGQAHDGIDSVPREGTWLLDKGERVVDSRTNRDLKDYLAQANGGSMSSGGSVNQNIYVTGTVDRRTSAQMAQDAARKQRIATARYGKG